MSNIQTGRILTTTEVDLIAGLNSLAVSGPLDVVQKTSSITFGNTTLAAGTNIVLTPVGNTITISAQNDATAVWGSITGTLADQIDLQNALNVKASNLAGLSALSLTTPNSLYTMTSTIPVEFRSSDGNPILYIDETNERVGIGTAAPSDALHIKATDGNTGFLRLQGANSVDNHLAMASQAITMNRITASNALLSISTAVNGSWGANGTAGAIQLSPGGSTAMTLLRTALVGISTSTPGAALDIANGNLTLIMGADSGATTRTNNTTKILRMGGYHYTNSEEPVGLLVINSTSTSNTLTFGGGSSLVNAATEIIFSAAANNTTTTGTEKMRVTSVGLGINNTGPDSWLSIIPTITRSNAGILGFDQQSATATLSGANPTTYATIYSSQIRSATLVGTNTNQTVTTAATLVLSGPIASTNVAITTGHTLLINAAAVGAGTTTSYGLTVNANTGGGANYAAQFLGGFVGINASTPSTRLVVATNTSAESLQIRRDSATTNEIATLGFRVSTSENAGNHAEIQAKRIDSPNSADTALIFRNQKSGTISESMRIDTTGFVGIGTTSPVGVLDIATAATNDDPTLSFRQARVATTDATVTTLQTIAIVASTSYLLEARVVARRTGGTGGTADDGAVYIRRAMVTTKTGTVTINAVQDDLTQEDQAGWDCTFTVSGTNVLLRVTGAADNNITWHTTTMVQLVSS